MHQGGGGEWKQRAENGNQTSAATWQPRVLLPAPGSAPGVTGVGGTRVPRLGVLVLLWHGNTAAQGRFGPAAGSGCQTPACAQGESCRKVAGMAPHARALGCHRTPGHHRTLGGHELGVSPLPQLPLSRARPRSEHLSISQRRGMAPSPALTNGQRIYK